MDLDQLKQILDLVREHELAEFEVEHEGLRLKIRKDAAGHPTILSGAGGIQSSTAAPALRSAAAAPVAGLPAADAESADVDLAVVKSPIVGTFYRSPEPGAPPFVEIGGTVKKGQVLCIIEAMKLMNEIESKVAGRVVKVFVENAHPVEFGQSLFLIDPAR